VEQVGSSLRLVLPDLAKRTHSQADFFLDLAHDGAFLALAWLDLAADGRPDAGVGHGRAASDQQHFIAARDDGHDGIG
jgi:hypothetical protein